MPPYAYRQCLLRRSTPDGHVEQTAFIPECYAKEDEVLRIRDNGEWVDGWVVATVYAWGPVTNALPDVRAGIRQHRKRTGDSLPKHG